MIKIENFLKKDAAEAINTFKTVGAAGVSCDQVKAFCFFGVQRFQT